MLAYGVEKFLGEATEAVLATTEVEFELIVVNNGTSSPVIGELAGNTDGRIKVLTPPRNLGFAGGVNLAAKHAAGEFLALVNSDAIVEPDTLRRLVDHLEQNPDVGAVSANVVLADQPDAINAAGQPLHVLGLSWAGLMNQPADTVPEVFDQVSASGAALVIAREQWEALDGFPEKFFAYWEDLELSWRLRQRGYKVQVLGNVRVRHHYEFSRSPQKMYLVERNRLLFVLTNYQARTLAALALPLIAFELAILAVALMQGWGRQKLAGWSWIVTHPRWLRRRRALVQSSRTVPDAALVGLMTTKFDAAQLPLPAAAKPLEYVLMGYWWVARRLFGLNPGRRRRPRAESSLLELGQRQGVVDERSEERRRTTASESASVGMVSVCMAAYNGAEFIGEQLRSILSELGPDDEVVIVDDVSTDDTVEVIESVADPRIRLLRAPRNRGYVKAFETAMLAARGEYLLLSDQDDVWVPGRVAAMKESLTSHNLVATNLAVLGSEDGLPGPYGQSDWRLNATDSRRNCRNIIGIYAGNRPYYGSAMGIRREAQDVILPFPRYLPEQYDLWMALYGNLTRSIEHLEIRSVEHRFHESNDTPNKPRWGLTVIYTRLRLLVLTVHMTTRLLRQKRTLISAADPATRFARAG